MSASPDCIFCKIARHELPANIVHEDDELLAFRDIQPQAPVHLLIIPKQHFTTLNDVPAAQAALLGRMAVLGRQLAAQEGIAERGFRLVMNCNAEGGQTVYHIHMHVLGGRVLRPGLA